MNYKEYKIKTIKEIFKVINDKNVDGFLTDFSTWVKLTIRLENLNTNSIKVLPNEDTFMWCDDGKWGEINELRINIK